MGKRMTDVEHGSAIVNGNQLADLSGHGDTPRVPYALDAFPDVDQLLTEEVWGSPYSDGADSLQTAASAAIYLAAHNRGGAAQTFTGYKLA